MVERQIGLDTTSFVGNKPREGGSPHTMQMQIPVPDEILNGNSPGGERPFRRTPLMRETENHYNGTAIDSILEDLYLGQKKSQKQIGRELGRSLCTIRNWFVRTGQQTRSARDGFFTWYAQRSPDEILAVKNSRTENKLAQVKETFGIDSERKFKSFLIKMYKKHHSLETMAKAFEEENGINVSSIAVRNWMSQFELDPNVLREEDNKNFVKRSVESGDFQNLTQNQRNVLESRGFFREGRLTPFRNLPEVQSKIITYQAAFDSEKWALRKLKRRADLRLKMAQDDVLRRPVGRPRKPLVA